MFARHKQKPQQHPDPKLRTMQADATLDWWRRNFKWVLIMGPGFFTLALIIGGIIGIYATNHSPLYTSAWQQVQTNPQVIAALGQPLDAGFLAQSQENPTTGQMIFNISGPNGDATVQHNAKRDNPQSDNWTTTSLLVYTRTNLGDQTIAIIQPTEPTDSPTEQ
ncbi:Cytochrome oxidase complex assembly protein 1 [Poriferisphaera corsica]|uniref:Cytochrome oxidase complex assembly protein 1 n=1 Tax=Poriferisphaera corsica TaxID=2528020 RepID=A0A517YZ14_9BACT|nr:cytochrome c oxidase assembly factor Coa1 family protein [Poriferisphaera corsica]QDU35465.1 Cytochrome oxidase complex assembly protein 1 [Poriferisphaera corsica]